MNRILLQEMRNGKWGLQVYVGDNLKTPAFDDQYDFLSAAEACAYAVEWIKRGAIADRPEIVAAVRENRELTDSEKITFGLDEIALNIRHWLKYTKDQRDKELLSIDGSTSVTFPVHPGYIQFELWAKTLDGAANLIRDRKSSDKPHDIFQPYENTLSIAELRREVRWLWDNERLLMAAIKSCVEMPEPRILNLLDRASHWPRDHDKGCELQRKYRLDIIPPITEYENGAGVWWRILHGLIMGDDT